jgi:hypothetical protein
MSKWIILLMIALVAPAFFMSGCSITGRSASTADDDLVACSLNTKVGFLEIDGSAQACHKDSYLYFMLDNMGSSTLTGLGISLESDYDLAMIIKEVIPPGETSHQGLSFGSQALDRITRLTITPLVGSGRTACRNAAVSIDISSCLS